MVSKYSVKRPITVFVAVIIVILLGVISFMNMTTDLLPSMDIPYVVVYTSYPGASPEKVETAVTKPLEQTLATTSGIKSINSISSENLSMIILEFNYDTNMDTVMLEMDSSIDMVEAYFDDMVSSPTLMRINPDMLPVNISSVDVEGMDTAELSAYVSEQVVPALERIDGVASVSANGIIEQELRVTLSGEKIGIINDRIIASLNETFDETEQKLNDARKEIKNARSKLNSESKKQKDQLEQGESAINAGIAQIDAALSQLGNRDDYVSQKEQLLREIAALELLKAEREREEASENPPTTGTTAADYAMQIMARETGVAGCDEAITTIDALTAQRDELVANRSELEAGSKMLDDALSDARSQLNSASREIEEQADAFADARADALENAKLDNILTADMISGILTASNFSMPAGYISVGEEQRIVKVGDIFISEEEMENLELMTIDVGDIGAVTLADVADVEFTDNADEFYAKVNGNNSIIITIQKQSTSSTVEVSHDVSDVFAQLEASNSALNVTSLNDQGSYIDIIINSVLQNLLMGGLLAMLVLLIFLRNIRPTVVVALSIPISLMFAVVLMYFTGVTMNIISLSGLALGVGMLVDNSIVVIENTFRLRAQGYSAKEAAIKGASQVAGAICASTLTTICVFLPIVFTEGLSRQLFTDMGLTIAYSLIASLIVALTLVPALSVPMMRTYTEKRQKWFDALSNGYAKLLGLSLKAKPVVIAVAVGLLIFAAFGAYNMGTAFMPSTDSSQLSVTMTMPEGSTTADTRAMSDEVMARIGEIEGVETVGANESSNSALASSGNKSISMYVILSGERTKSSEEISLEITEKTADLDCEVAASGSGLDNMSMLTGSGISVQLRGSDLDALQDCAAEVSGVLSQVEGIADIDDGLGETSPELRVTVDKNKALSYGLTVAQIYSSLADALADSGTATTVTIDSVDYAVTVSDDSTVPLTPDTLGDFVVAQVAVEDDDDTADEEATERDLLLSEVATITQEQSLNSIYRENQSRYVTVSAGIAEGYNIGLVSRDVEAALAEYEPPKGINLEIEGENETINETLADLVLMLLIAAALIYLIMVAQFQSLLSPFIVIFTIPLAFTGGLIALMIAGMELSVISMLGFLVLSGVIVNNGIVLVDYINQLREGGMRKRDAIITAGRTRMRPILMTAITTIFGLFTLALGIGEGADLIQPLAVVTVGGMVYGTLMTLFIVPALYDVFNRKKYAADTGEGQSLTQEEAEFALLGAEQPDALEAAAVEDAPAAAEEE